MSSISNALSPSDDATDPYPVVPEPGVGEYPHPGQEALRAAKYQLLQALWTMRHAPSSVAHLAARDQAEAAEDALLAACDAFRQGVTL